MAFTLPTRQGGIYLLAALVALVLAAIQPGNALAASRYVDDSGTNSGDCTDPGAPCRTITYAISQSVAGDTINVEAGVYNETVTVDKRLRFHGANQGVDARTRPDAQLTESNVTNGWFIQANNVVVDGFTLKNSNGTGELGAGLDISAASSGHLILNNIVKNNGLGIYLNGSDITVRRNLISGNNGDLCGGACPVEGIGIFSDLGATDVTIELNAFTGHDRAWLHLIGSGSQSGGAAEEITIANNSALEDGALVLETTRLVSVEDNIINVRDDNAEFCCNAIILTQGTSETDIVRNSITGTSAVGQIEVTAPPSGWSGVYLKACEVSAPRSVGSTAASGPPLDCMGLPHDDVLIAGNRITGADFGIGIDENALSATADLEGSFNRIAANTAYGAYDDADNVDVNLRNNWWGCNEGPDNGPNETSGTDCDSVTESSVDADGWLVLTLATMEGGKTIAAGGAPTLLSADLNQDAEGNLPTPDPAGGRILDSTQVCFKPAAKFAPDCDGTADGVAFSTFTGTPGTTARAHAVLDAETVGTDGAPGDGDENEVAISEPATDNDGDGVANAEDNCPDTINEGQQDRDNDGQGDACDTDDDNDGVLDETDNCPLNPNAEQRDRDEDGTGDRCDPDRDDDGVANEDDNCKNFPNAGQGDFDGDGRGNKCDVDLDGDGVNNSVDNCRAKVNPGQVDSDGDGRGNGCDPTPFGPGSSVVP
ncbi:MAG: thrombospondin type 3 repeat-containing protein [Dehalococcoidia bacterium]